MGSKVGRKIDTSSKALGFGFARCERMGWKSGSHILEDPFDMHCNYASHHQTSRHLVHEEESTVTLGFLQLYFSGMHDSCDSM